MIFIESFKDYTEEERSEFAKKDREYKKERQRKEDLDIEREVEWREKKGLYIPPYLKDRIDRIKKRKKKEAKPQSRPYIPIGNSKKQREARKAMLKNEHIQSFKSFE